MSTAQTNLLSFNPHPILHTIIHFCYNSTNDSSNVSLSFSKLPKISTIYTGLSHLIQITHQKPNFSPKSKSIHIKLIPLNFNYNPKRFSNQSIFSTAFHTFNSYTSIHDPQNPSANLFQISLPKCCSRRNTL